MNAKKNFQVLLIHGFTGSSHDMSPLFTALLARGMSVESLVLAGHETSPEGLENTRMEEWISGAQAALNRFDPKKPLIIVALSMGTFLATLLAADKNNRVDAIALLSPAFMLTWPGRLAVFLCGLGLSHIKPFLPKNKGSDICDVEARRANRSYKKIPVRALYEFNRLRERAIISLPKVSCPVFLGFGSQEHTVDIEKSKIILKKLGTSHVSTHIYAKSAHILPVDFDKNEVCNDVMQFIESLK